MKTLTCNLPDSLYEAVKERMAVERSSCDHVVALALSQCLEKPLHTLFQVSTSAALVEGLYQGTVCVSQLLEHGDFGIGTFVGLDGEMVVLDGVCYRVASSGSVAEVEGQTLIPYAVVTRFRMESTKHFINLDSLQNICEACDTLRDSDNLFFAFRIDGRFSFVKTRVVGAVDSGTGLLAAASAQNEFLFEAQNGTLVGLWSPGFAGSFSVPGYHFHFLSNDRQKGGHVLECNALELTVGACAMNEMHVSLPETEEFLRADLTRDSSNDLIRAEQNSGSKPSTAH